MNKKEYQQRCGDQEFIDFYRKIHHFLNQIRKLLTVNYRVSNLTKGDFDYSYFYINHPLLKEKQQRLGLFFNHPKFRLEWWLIGQNKNVIVKDDSNIQVIGKMAIDLKEAELSHIVNKTENILQQLLKRN